MQMEHKQLQRLNMNLSHQIQMRHRAVYVYIVYATTRKGWRMFVEAHERYNKRLDATAISVYFKEWVVRAVSFLPHNSCLLISLFWTGE